MAKKFRPTDFYRDFGTFEVRRRAKQYDVLTQLFDTIELSKELGRVNGKTLTQVGLDVRDAAKRGIGQTPPARTKAGARAIGADRLVELHGGVYRDLNVTFGGRPRPAGKPVKSWAPNRFLYRDILSVLDSSRGTVVIGPYRAPWLNQLHQFGGTVTQVAYGAGAGVARYAAMYRRRTGKLPTDRQGRQLAGAILWTHRRGDRSPMPSVTGWQATNMTRQATYPARPFMAGSAQVDKAVAKAAEWFRETFNPRRA